MGTHLITGEKVAIKILEKDKIKDQSDVERVTREMGKAFAGVGKEEKDDDARVVDSLIVLCSCPDYLKQRISDVSKVTMDWEIDAPTSLRLTEGDEAYLRVSRQIRDKVYNLLNELKEYALKEAG